MAIRIAATAAVLLSALVLFGHGCRRARQYHEHELPATKPDYGRPLPPGAPALRLCAPSEVPDFSADLGDKTPIIEAIGHNLAYMAKPSSKAHFPVQGITHERVARSLEELRRILKEAKTPEELDRMVREKFDVYISVGWDGSGTVLFTGYCSPVFEASRTRTGEFIHPLYKLPEDLAKGPDGEPLGRRKPDGAMEPYPTRAEIEKGRLLDGKGLELVWLKDKFEAYIVHIQGSAILKLSDGAEMMVGYAGKTDRKYVSVGEELVKDGKISRSEKSLKTIWEYFKAHPEELDEYLHRNESYVFFQEISGGPYGSLNVPVTAWRTLATDKRIFPRASVCFVDTRVPVGYKGVTRPFRQFMLDQDTGGAIRSAGRADIYMGVGNDAMDLAGRTQSEGRLYYLFVKE